MQPWSRVDATRRYWTAGTAIFPPELPRLGGRFVAAATASSRHTTAQRLAFPSLGYWTSRIRDEEREEIFRRVISENFLAYSVQSIIGATLGRSKLLELQSRAGHQERLKAADRLMPFGPKHHLRSLLVGSCS